MLRPASFQLALLAFSFLAVCAAQASDRTQPASVPMTDRAHLSGKAVTPESNSYILGPEDTLNLRVLDADEIGTAPYPIDLKGNLNVPRLGLVHAASLTLDQLQADLTDRYKEYLQHPVVTLSVAEYRSQPISVLGAVTTPGVHQIRGRKTLFEVISEAGGLKADAGDTIKITRPQAFGPIPLPDAKSDSTGEYTVAEVSIRSVMDAQNPAQNIAVRPNDVITVPKAQLIYVIGDVKKPGGFALSERSNMSVLEALSLAEGLSKTAGAKNAKILRAAGGSANRSEIPVNVQKILSGQNGDVPLLANDILFIPNSIAKSATARAIESMIQIGTGVVIYAHPF